MSGESIKGAGLGPQLLLNPNTTNSFDASSSAFARSHRKDQSKDPMDDSSQPTSVFEFLGTPGNGVALEGFGKAMATLENVNGKGGYLDFNWSRFDVEGSIIADIGSGVGHVALSILPALKHAVVKNYDLQEVCENGKKFFAEHAPNAISSGKVSFASTDFFTDAPVDKGANVYILSNILHDWDNVKAGSILSNVVKSMSATSRLLVFEIVTVPTLTQHTRPKGTEKDVLSASAFDGKIAPYPLLADWGVVNRYPQLQGMELINLLNGIDRTLPEYTGLFQAAGLELVQVHRVRKLVSIMELKKA